jgi:hypothetical protein
MNGMVTRWKSATSSAGSAATVGGPLKVPALGGAASS